MEAIYLTEDNQAVWEEFAAQSDMAWFRHTVDWLKYSACCRFDSNTVDVSFMVKQSGKIQAIVPLLVEYDYPDRTTNTFAMYGDNTPLPAYANESDIDRSKVDEFIWDEIRKIADKYHVTKAKFMVDPLIKYPYFNDFASFNLLEKGFQLEFTTTNVVDLTLDIDVILRKMRKGHKAAVKQVLQQGGYHVDIFEANTINHDILLKFKAIHFKDAGRQTRTDESWEWMYRWITAGKAFLALLYLDEKQDYAAGALIMQYKDAAYYASFATTDSYMLNGHCGQAIQWEVIKHLKEKGYSRYETGRNYFADSQYAGDAKRMEISKYQRGYRSIEIPKLIYTKDAL